MLEQMPPGKLIVFEGPDRVGKSTLADALTKKLVELDIPCEHLALPGRIEGTVGRLVDDIHHAPKTFGLHQITPTSLQALHVAAQLDAIERIILPALNRGTWVVLDRFWWSTWVYGSADGVAPGILDAMITVARLPWAGKTPDALFLANRVDTSLDVPNLDALRAGYDVLLKREQGKYPVSTIANEGLLDDSLDQILEKLRELILNNGRTTTDMMRTPDEYGPPSPVQGRLSIFSTLSPARETDVYDTFWRFAAERQEVFFRKIEGYPPPWTDDPVIGRHKFTNAYRASDRVSQYLIRRVIYEEDDSPEEVFFRTILFKLFNKVETWELLTAQLGPPTYRDYSFDHYDRVLTEAISAGVRIYSGAYIMPSGNTAFGYRAKHRNHLKLLESMMTDRVADRIADASSMSQAFELLRSYPTIGDFLSYQFVTDLNYSKLSDFSELEFTSAGPGALDGVHKCFSDLGGLSEADIIRLVTYRQEEEFERRGIEFRSLWGRPLQFIDCQNLFCEVSKYARVKHPDVKGTNDRTRIKQVYRPANKPLIYWFPPKWGINEMIPKSGMLA